MRGRSRWLQGMVENGHQRTRFFPGLASVNDFNSLSLRGFYIVPNFGVLRTTWNILPEINPFLIVLHIVQMKAFDFIRGHELPSLGIRGPIMHLVVDQLLSFALVRRFKKFVRK